MLFICTATAERESITPSMRSTENHQQCVESTIHLRPWLLQLLDVSLHISLCLRAYVVMHWVSGFLSTTSWIKMGSLKEFVSGNITYPQNLRNSYQHKIWTTAKGQACDKPQHGHRTSARGHLKPPRHTHIQAVADLPRVLGCVPYQGSVQEAAGCPTSFPTGWAAPHPPSLLWSHRGLLQSSHPTSTVSNSCWDHGQRASRSGCFSPCPPPQACPSTSPLTCLPEYLLVLWVSTPAPLQSVIHTETRDPIKSYILSAFYSKSPNDYPTDLQRKIKKAYKVPWCDLILHLQTVPLTSPSTTLPSLILLPTPWPSSHSLNSPPMFDLRTLARAVPSVWIILFPRYTHSWTQFTQTFT